MAQQLGAEQRQIVRRIKGIGQQVGATPKEIKAALETGIVESGLRNLPGGDADSAGWRQERASLYKNPTNLDASIHRFFQETRAVRDKYGQAGALAAAVQRPAAQYRGRYQGVSGQAQALLGTDLGSSGSAAPQSRSAGTPATPATPGTPGIDNSAQRAVLISQFLGRAHQDPLQFALGIKGLQDTPAVAGTPGTPAKPAKGAANPARSSSGAIPAPPEGHGTVPINGHEVVAWMVPALNYARAHGWKGTVISGVRSRALQAQLYQTYVNSGFSPAHIAAKPGQSNHEIQNGGAMDLSDPDGFAKAIAGFKGRKPIQGLAIGDRPHFSATGR